MKFTIVERKMKIDDDLRAYALRKVEKLDRYFQQDSDTTLTFSEPVSYTHLTLPTTSRV